MLSKIIGISNKHFKNNLLLYLIIIICLLIGISAGAITIKILNSNQKQEIITFLNSFLKILNNENEIESFLLLKQSMINNIQTVIIIWILGITVIGIPVIMGVITLRGFVTGFTVGFLFDEFGFKGLVFSLLAILPQNIFIIPGIVILAVISINFSIKIVKNKIRRDARYSFLKEFFYYTTSTLLLIILFIFGSIIEAYITPVFMKLISGYLS